MSARSRQSLLHLQMGQEVIYLIFTVSLLAAFLLALYALHLEERLPAEEVVEEPPPVVEEAPPALPAPTPIKPDPDLGLAMLAAPDPASELPPILALTEAEGYFFELGSAALTRSFVRKLRREVVPRLAEAAARYKIDVIEVVGHTDEVPVRARASTLDRDLLGYLQGIAAAEELVVADNVGLGMARAAAVARELIADTRLRLYTILPLSAGQAIDLGERLARSRDEKDIRERRRIEIRMRRRAKGG